ncbi:HNH endonuclease [Alicyclobacillus shizuokensis]|uniref:HNH endonuclease n=1 Tax=Alicyclobacillus shizuokensis TaxID=392014 RepID=UPI0009F81929|nr:HNH endonuclease [Alicyclobacillus shizuokensis]
MREFASAFYHSQAWLRCRESYLKSKHYVCERCGGLAKIVHHKVYLTPGNIDDPTITLNWDNLEALCQDCHNAEHMCSQPICADGLKFDTNGNLVQTPRVCKWSARSDDRPGP